MVENIRPAALPDRRGCPKHTFGTAPCSFRVFLCRLACASVTYLRLFAGPPDCMRPSASRDRQRKEPGRGPKAYTGPIRLGKLQCFELYEGGRAVRKGQVGAEKQMGRTHVRQSPAQVAPVGRVPVQLVIDFGQRQVHVPRLVTQAWIPHEVAVEKPPGRW